MPIYLNDDYGDAIIRSGVAYEKIAQVQADADTAVDPADTLNITGITYTVPDSNSKTVYSAGERAVSLLNSAIFELILNFTKRDFFTAPADGVFRFYSAHAGRTFRIWIGGLLVYDGITIPVTEVTSTPLPMLSGQLMEIENYSGYPYSGVYITWTFLPNTYPIV